MTAATIAFSALNTSLARYWRSWGLWLLLLVAPIGARYMIQLDGQGVIIAINSQLPVMTSAFLGVSLGIVVSTLLLPIAWLYLRSNTTRRQPWQVEEVSSGSRVAIALGRFAADGAVLLITLAALTLAGWFLGWLVLPFDQLNVAHITIALWLVAAPALLGLAALRILFDARPLTRSGFGDFLYFVLWIASIAVPAAAEGRAPGFVTNMYDFAGFVTPLVFGAPAGADSFAISIGGIQVEQGRVALDVMAGLFSPGYVESRLAWAGVAVALVVLAGLVYHPHRARRSAGKPGRLTAWLQPGPPPRAIPNAPAAKRSFADALGLVAAEVRLIGAGRVFLVLAAVVAVLTYVSPDFRHGGSVAALLLLVFALSAHAGRSEARGLVALTKVAPFAPMARRLAFVLAGAIWSTLMALPALVRHPPLETLSLASLTGAGAALVAIMLSALSGSGFAARLVLLILWYGYAST